MSLRSCRFRPLGVASLVVLLAACGGATPSTPPAASVPPTPSTAPTSGAPSSVTPSTDTPVPSPSDSGTPEPLDSGGGSTVKGDVPDNAVFLTFDDPTNGFSIQYVEGWQATTQPDGVAVRDKDSSEIAQVVPGQTDAAAYEATDLAALRQQTGFQLEKQDTVAVKGHGQLAHLLYHLPAPPDPVTGKEIPSTVDRYYVPGTGKLAVVSLSTPDGVDNVDAFRQMIESFQWK